MNSEPTTHRRGFLGRMFGAAAAAGLSMSATRAAAAAGVGRRRLDQGGEGHAPLPVRFPAAQERLPAAAHPELPEHLRDGLQDRRRARSAPSARSTASGSQASIPLAFNDAIWAKYELGDYTGLKDAAGKPYTRNVFNRPTPKDLHLLMQAIDSPMIPALAEAMPALGIESLQKMGTKFVLCANALGIWCLELEARGKGKAQDIEKELRANLLPGVTIVPAMVIAIEKAQEAGIKYNRQ